MTPTRRRKQARSSIPTPRWEHWQAAPIARRYLPEEARAQGYTIVRIPPGCREAFVDIVTLLRAYGQWQARRHTPTYIDAAWTTWWTWTRQLTAALARLLAHHPATVPAVPVAVVTLLEAAAPGPSSSVPVVAPPDRSRGGPR